MITEHSNTFASDIEQICQEKRLDYIDAVVHWCESKNLDIEYGALLVKKDAVMKSKIQVLAENINVLKKTAKLPV